MKSPVLILAAQPSAEVQAILRERADLRTARTLPEMSALVHRTPAFGLALFEPRDASGASSAGGIREFRAQRPGVPLLIYYRPGHDAGRDVVACIRAGGTHLAIAGGGELRTTVDEIWPQVEAGPLAEQVIAAARRHVPPDLHPFVEHCLQASHQPLAVGDACTALGMSRRTLTARLSRAGLPSASRLAGWFRVLAAATALESGREGVERIALRLGFASSAGLRNLFRRYLAVGARGVRGMGVAPVVNAFEAELVSHRRVVPARRGPR